MTKIFRIYGIDGHRQQESFNPSYTYDFSKDSVTRIIEVRNADITGTNDYTELVITRNSEQECYDELNGQLSDGIFENVRVGDWKEV